MARTMATITERRAAAELRRRQAGEAGERGGDAAFRQYRSQAPGVGRMRVVGMPSQVRAKSETRNGKTMTRTEGFFTRYERGYPMWDVHGQYEEVIGRGAGRETLASKPNVMFLVNHKGVTMARTHNGTLILEERAEGGWHDAWLNPERPDVQIIATAIADGDVEEMSFAFMIPDGAGEWSSDFMTFRIGAYDIDRGDVSAVNMGANPNTDIAARTPQILDDLDRLPEGALPEAAARLARRSGAPIYAQGGRTPQRESITVRTEPRAVDPSASHAVRALQGRTIRTAARLVDYAMANSLGVADLASVRLPWYEIRNDSASAEGGPDEGDAPESTDVLIFDEIGGSFGVDAKTFAEDLNAISTPKIRIRFSSPGGDVFQAKAIHSAILHHPAHVTGYADGLVASAASLIFMACDERVMMPAGELMLHDASMVTDGNAADHGKGETFLDRHSDNLADIYAERMGVTREEARQIMLDETWAFPDEAVKLGLADRISTRADMLAEGDPKAERMRRSHDLSLWPYRYQGRAAAPAPQQTRAGAAHSAIVEGQERAAAVRAEIEHRAERAERSTPPEPKGRSIALIRAALAVAERE